MHRNFSAIVSRLGSSLTSSAWLFVLAGAACSTTQVADPLGTSQESPAGHEVEPATLGAGSYAQIPDFGPNPGGYRMFLYTPPGLDTVDNAPAVLFFHGCTQQATNARNLGWEKMADTMRFYLAYPEQPSGNNPATCFNWAGEHGDPANLIRGQGENQSAASMVNFLRTNRKVDPKRVYAAGFSAGGAMVAVMLSTWPDLFAAGAINAGLPYRCAGTVNEAYNCQFTGRDRTPAEWGQSVRAAFPEFTGTYPRLTIWHGTSDGTVVPMNQRELRDQWTHVHGIGQTPDEQDTIAGFPRARYLKSGKVAVETVSINGMNHGVTVDPAMGCGQAGSFAYDKKLCAAKYQAEFLLGGASEVPGKAPKVYLDAPGEGAVVSGAVSIRGRVTDEDDAVTKVVLDVDGVTRASLPNPPPSFELSWNAAAETSGAHRLSLSATDQAGHRTSVVIQVRVDGGMGAEETAAGTCSQHYVAKRLNTTRYLACGRCNGYINSVTLYRFGTRWTDSPTGMGCMDR